jgi:hypothetical protein
MDPEDPMFLPGISDAVRSQGTLAAFVLGEDEVPVSHPARQTGTVSEYGGADFVGAFDKRTPGTDTEVILGEHLRTVLEVWSFGEKDSVGFLELLPCGSATIGTVTEGEFDRRRGVLFCGINQIECPGLVVAVPGQDVGGGNKLRFRINGDCRLVAIEAVTLALASVAFVGTVYRDNPVFGNALFDCRNTVFGALDILGQE